MFRPPPADLRDRHPLIFTAAKAHAWFRSYRAGRDAVYFGRHGFHRWDAPNGEFGVLYLAADEYCAFMESIGRGALRTRFIPAIQLRQARLCKVGFSRDLRLIDFAGSGGLTRMGAEGSVSSVSGYGNSQRWSQALKSHPSKPDGIYYRSRFDPARMACALFDACARQVKILEDCGTWAEQPRTLGAILDHYGFGTDL
ncbi:MAG: RES family NAD+ phosphorylase [Bryobacteraceae bacterium]|nr:RES family NAD+ phosphorylase [Bryobacteraceae bacterium]